MGIHTLSSAVIFLYLCTSNASFLRKLRTVLMGGKNNKTIEWEFISESELQYPGNNAKKIEKVQEAWARYYNCLTHLNTNFGPYKSIKPEVIMVFEGSSVKMECKSCVRPSDTTRIDDVLWNYRTIPPKGTSLVELGEHKLISPRDKTLHMYGLTIQDTGQYFCQRGETVTSAYFLEVVNSSEPTLQVHPATSEKGPYPEPPKIMTEKNLQVLTTWSEWSKCSTCGIVGKRVRYGICAVQNLINNSSIKVETQETTEFTPQKKITSNTTIKDNTTDAQESSPKQNQAKRNGSTISLAFHSVENALRTMKSMRHDQVVGPYHNITSENSIAKNPENIFNLFSGGIPCRSRMLPDIYRQLQQVKERKSEILVGFCKESCPVPTIFQVLDEKGKVLETANNTAGIFSTLQGIPAEKPTVQRDTIYEDTLSRNIILRCPGNLNSDIPIQWQMGSFNVDSATIYVLSRGRIILNILDQIVIKEPSELDSNIYSCWQNGELAGTIRLIVTKRMELNFNHEIMLLSLILIIGTFVLIFFRAFRARNRTEAQ